MEGNHITEYYEGLHKRRQNPDFNLKEEITWVILNGESQDLIVDMLLCLDATINMDIDINSTKKNKESIRASGREIYRAIKKVNKKLGDDLLQHQDK